MKRLIVCLLVLAACDAWLLLRTVMEQGPDELPAQVEIIVLEAWASDGVSRQAFDLAQRFVGAKVVTVGAASNDVDVVGTCLEGAAVGEKTRSQLVSWGLRPERVVSLRQAERGTRNEAATVASWMRAWQPEAHGLVIVTEWFHRQRSRLTYRNVMPEADVRVGVPSALFGGPGEPQWTRRDRFIAYLAEFVKLGYYQLRGWISPLQLMPFS